MRFRWVILSLVVLVLATLMTGNCAWLTATVALAALLGLALGWRRFVVGEVTGTRQLSAQVVAWGGILEQQLILQRSAWLFFARVTVLDHATLPDHARGFVIGLPPRRQMSSITRDTCVRRGHWQLGPVVVTTSDLLGILPRQRVIGHQTSILVLPRWIPITRCALTLDGLRPGDARSTRGAESPPAVTCVREYTPGDPLAAIHWPATARSGQLMTKQYAPDVQTLLWLALDLDGGLPGNVEELLVTATATLGMYGLQRANLRVGLLASGWGAIHLPPESGRPQQQRLLGWLAEAHMGTGAALRTHLTTHDRELRPGHILVLLTSQAPGAWRAWIASQRRKGLAVRVVSVHTAVAPGSGGGSAAEDPGAPPTADVGASWDVPQLALDAALADPALEAHLMDCLQGGTARPWRTQAAVHPVARIVE